MAPEHTDLTKQECEPCKGDTPPLGPEKIEGYMEQLGDQWSVQKNHHLTAEYGFDDFRQALDFTNEVGKLAEQEGHHPDIRLSWGKVGIEIYTHEANGLTRNDFILAAKISSLRGDG